MPAPAPSPTQAPPHQLNKDQVATQLQVDPAQGLSHEEARSRLQQHGLNELPAAQPRSWWARLLSPFKDFMIVVLLAAAVISGVMGDLTDTVVILIIVVLNAAIAITQEWQADQAMELLKRMVTAQAQVRREGQPHVVDSAHLVPGDVVHIEAGNFIPADLRLHHVAQLRVDESALTGESVSVTKHTDALTGGAESLGDRLNMGFKGTLVTHGRAVGLVVSTGAQTELGKVATLLQDSEERSTPLQRRLAAFGQRLSLAVLLICGVVFVLGLLRGEPWLLMALTAISLAVAAIPEALPAVVTVLLALGARRLVQVQALIRKLPAVETLGSVTTICSDKTGTLTLNRMAVVHHRHWGPNEKRLWEAVTLCNDAHASEQGWLGDPTETALLAKAEAEGLDVTACQAQHPRLGEWPFDSDRKRMTTLHRQGDGWLALVKGAPESVLPRCTQIGTAQGAEPLPDPEALLTLARTMAEQGMRVLAVAQRTGQTIWEGVTADAFEDELTLVGLVGLMDPPRPEAKAAVHECRQAGIRPVMITGDHPATALAIARQLGIAPLHPDTSQPESLTGEELAFLDDNQLQAIVPKVSVYARMDPAQKIRIVSALQAQGEFVAMTGDGVNDAPALKAADIGVAMGLNGTDVARESASLVLLDDHFATIVAAVREGRRIFDNIRKFIRYAMSGNSGEIWVLFLAPFLGLPVPLLPIHILWINLVTDGLPGLALATEPAEPGIMQRPPRPPGESVFAHGLWQHTIWVGLLIGLLCLGVQAWALHIGDAHWQTMVFTTLTLTQMAHLLGIRSETQPLWRLGLRSNLPLLGAVALTVVMQLATVYIPAFNDIFHTAPLTVAELLICVACATLVWLAVEAEKAWRVRSGRV